MRSKKNLAIFAVTVFAISSLMACSASTEETGGEYTESDSEKASAKIGVVLSVGGLGDKNFNDMAYEGMLKAQEELGIEFDYMEPETISDYIPNLRSMCEAGEYDLIIGLGADMSDAITDITLDFPEQKFSHIDSTLEIDNVSAISTKWEEQTFLTGVVAGLGTKSKMQFANEENVIGVVLGKSSPALEKGVIGFKAGARYVNPDVEILEGNVNSFADPDKGKEIAVSMYNQGADFIQSIAGPSGIGIFNASQEMGKYSFGVGANINYLQPDNIIATASREVDEIIYQEIKSYLDGTWSSGIHISGMKEGAVGYDAGESNVVLPEEIESAVEKIRQEIIDGTLVPPDTEEKLEEWVLSHQYTD